MLAWVDAWEVRSIPRQHYRSNGANLNACVLACGADCWARVVAARAYSAMALLGAGGGGSAEIKGTNGIVRLVQLEGFITS